MGKIQFKTIVAPPKPKVVESLPQGSPTVDVTDGVQSITTTAKLPQINKAFLFAGRATFIAESPKGDHFTFRVGSQTSEWPLGSGKKNTTFFLNVRAAGGRRKPNGSQSPWRYIGILKDTGDIKPTAKSEYKPDDKLFAVAAWSVRQVLDGKLLPEGYAIHHAGKCGKCGRELTDPTSMERGIGPDCWEAMGN